MKNCCYNLFIVLVLLFNINCNAMNPKNHEVLEIEKYKINLPKKLIEETGGFYTGVGSGLEFSKKLPNGNL